MPGKAEKVTHRATGNWKQTPLPVEMDRFMPSSRNTTNLEALIHRTATEAPELTECKCWGGGTENCTSRSSCHKKMDERDVLILCEWTEIRRPWRIMDKNWCQGHVKICLLTRLGWVFVKFCLPAVHTLTGCDYTSKYDTKHAALKAPWGFQEVQPADHFTSLNVICASMRNIHV